jgi:hypothetical protein
MADYLCQTGKQRERASRDVRETPARQQPPSAHVAPVARFTHTGDLNWVADGDGGRGHGAGMPDHDLRPGGEW